jgi:hypothetical protein
MHNDKKMHSGLASMERMSQSKQDKFHPNEILPNKQNERYSDNFNTLRNQIDEIKIDDVITPNEYIHELGHRNILSNGIYHFTNNGEYSNPRDIKLYSGETKWFYQLIVTIVFEEKKGSSIYLKVSKGDELNEMAPMSTIKSEDGTKFSFDIHDFSNELTISVSSGFIMKSISLTGCGVDNVKNLHFILESIKDNIEDENKYQTEFFSENFESRSNELLSLTKEIEYNNKSLESVKNRLSSATKEIKERESYIVESDSRLEANQKMYEDLSLKNNELKAMLLGAEDLVSIANDRFNTINETIQSDVNELSLIKKNIATQSAQLSKYKKEASVYSTELKDFKKEISQQNIAYSIALVFFCYVLVVIFKEVFASSLLYIEMSVNLNEINLVQLFLSRSPLIIFNVGIIAISFRFSFILINNIIRNNVQVSDIKKIEFLVKESVESLNLSSEDTIKKRLEYKMEIIREYLNINQKINKDVEVAKDKNIDEIMTFIKSIKDLSSKDK